MKDGSTFLQPSEGLSKQGVSTQEREEKEPEQSRLADKFREEDAATWRGSNARP